MTSPRAAIGGAPAARGTTAAAPAGVAAVLAAAAALAACAAAAAAPGNGTDALATDSAGAPFLGSRFMLHVAPPRVGRGPVVDGALDDPVWAQAAVLDSFTQIDPIEGLPDTLGTQCLVLYDDHAIYVGFRCFDDPKRVRAPFLPRQDVDASDWVAVGIDAHHDRRRMAYFTATPRGIQADGMVVEGQEDDDDVDFLYASEGRITARGYEVEMAIPFRSLRFPRRDSLTFGFNASRWIPRTGVFLSWAPVSSDKGPAVAQIGTLQRLAAVRPGRNIQMIPTFTASRAAWRVAPGGLRSEPAATRSGASVKVGVTSSLTADATVTPDFSQVEADAAVVDVNERFAIFYPEKRPFFLEGREIFATPIDLVYTRRIADPRWGARMTGTQGSTALGVLLASDRSAGLTVATLADAHNPYAGRDAGFQIARVRQNVGAHSTVGLLAGNREQRGAYNRAAGLDGRFVMHERWTLSGQAVKSWSRARDYRAAIAALSPGEHAALDDAVRADSGQARSGDAWTVALAHASRGLDAALSVLSVAPDFAADMGFVPRTDQFHVAVELEPHWFARGRSWFEALHPELSYQRIHAHGPGRRIGARTDDELEAEIQVNLPLSTWAGAGYYRVFTRHEGRAFPNQDRVALWAGSSRHALVQWEAFASQGGDVVFEENVPGTSLRWTIDASLRPTPQVAAAVGVAGLRLERRESGVRFADAVIPRLKLTYQHNRELSLRLIGELDAERRYDPSGARVPTATETRLDVLLAWLLRPGTVCYLGYGSRLLGEEVRSSRPEQTNTFFKVSWLWQP